MNEQILKLIVMFDLHDDVAAFVKAKVKERAGKKVEFSFEGSCRQCGNKEGHVPHEMGSYDTVRYGQLAHFCMGASGNGLEVVIESYRLGSPELPSSIRGFVVSSI